MPEAIVLPPFSQQTIRIIGDLVVPSNPPSVLDITKALHHSRTLLNENGTFSSESVLHSAVGFTN